MKQRYAMDLESGMDIQTNHGVKEILCIVNDFDTYTTTLLFENGEVSVSCDKVYNIEFIKERC